MITIVIALYSSFILVIQTSTYNWFANLCWLPEQYNGHTQQGMCHHVIFANANSKKKAERDNVKRTILWNDNGFV